MLAVEILITAAAALFGVWLGKMLEAHRERSSWTRDAKFRAYQPIIAEASEILQIVRAIDYALSAKGGSGVSHVLHKTYFERAREFRQATHAAHLVGSDAVWRQLVNLIDVLNDTVTPAVEHLTPNVNRGDLVWQRLSPVIDAMREDLKAKPIPDFRSHDEGGH